MFIVNKPLQVKSQNSGYWRMVPTISSVNRGKAIRSFCLFKSTARNVEPDELQQKY